MRESNSIRAMGKVVTVALDQPTKASLKQLAGDMPVAHYLRDLVQRELKRTGRGHSLPGFEKSSSLASLPAIQAQLCALSDGMDVKFNEILGLVASLAAGRRVIVSNKPGGWAEDAPHILVQDALRRFQAIAEAEIRRLEGSELGAGPAEVPG